MSTLIKVLLGILAAGVVLFLALIIAVTVIFEPDDYRPYVVDAVERSTGRDFALEGELGLSVFPCCAVSLGPARLGNPEGFPDEPFATLESAAASVKLWPLLMRREVEVGTVTLRGLELDLVRLADGRANWEFTDPDAPAGAEEGAGEESALAALRIDGLEVEEGRLRYRDQQADQDYTVSGIRLFTGTVAMAGERVDVEAPSLELTARGDQIPGDGAAVSVAAQSVAIAMADDPVAELDALVITLAVLDARMRITGSGRAGAAPNAMDVAGEFHLEQTSPRELLTALAEDGYRPADNAALTRLAAEGEWTVAKSALEVADLVVTLDNSRLTGSLAVTDFDTGASRFDLTLDRLAVDDYLPAEESAGGDSAAPAEAATGGPTVLPLDALAALDVAGTLTIGELSAAGVNLADVQFSLTSDAGGVHTALSADLLEGSLQLDGRGEVSGDSPQLAGTLTLHEMSPRSMLDELEPPVETADPEALTHLAGQAQWRLTPRTLTVPRMRWTLDDTTATGSVSVADFDTLALGFDLVVDRLNLDDYLAGDDAQAAEDETEEEIPVEMIRGLALDGRLRAGQLTVSGLDLRNVDARVEAADGVLRLAPLTAALYGGDYRGSVVLDATGTEAKLTLDQALSAVQVGEIVRTFFDTDVLGGSLSLDLSGTGSGNTAMALLEGLAAGVNLEVSDGVYRGADLLYELRRARALLRNEAAPAEPATRETPLKALAMQGSMADGVLQTRSLAAETTAMRLVGEGGINLMELTLDYDLKAELLGEPADGASKLEELVGNTIPFTLTGPVTAPKVGVDLQGMLTTRLRETVQERARGALLDKLGGKPAAGEAPADESAEDAAAPAADEPAEEPSPGDLLERGLRDLLKPRQEAEPEPDTN